MQPQFYLITHHCLCVLTDDLTIKILGDGITTGQYRQRADRIQCTQQCPQALLLMTLYKMDGGDKPASTLFQAQSQALDTGLWAMQLQPVLQLLQTL